ncbi:aliphatic sulfonate ABC transporter substrate-binding protein [Paenibacillus sp. LMG 31456]|uniref:Aliphatic sulfonate ABC transporter substrate-binding protein n=1 Tax=Paenibacillus foliorum TaxID=2654974 RepID=A0A972GW99_9BACL|nr:aliphatic sulfonate ABC transporter substrate-binding protein [Paenibacillus foliorum]NOU91711.1 aliphatic sulfonate ABC transporter substrate-binding protein [Paenibacillus foliorum]
MKTVLSNLFPFRTKGTPPEQQPVLKDGELNGIWGANRALNDSSTALEQFVKGNLLHTEAVSLAVQHIVQATTTQTQRTEESLEHTEKLGILLDASLQDVAAANASVGITTLSSRLGVESIQTVQLEAAKSIEITSNLIEVMGDLQTKSKQIAEAIDMISSVAANIQLLALNASIEAAHAGEHGKGFAVVAQEIRNLATESNAGGHQMRKVLEEIRKQIEACSSIVKKTALSSQTVHQAAETAAETFRGIDRGLEEVNGYMGQVNHSLSQANEAKVSLWNQVVTITALSQESLGSALKVADLSESQASSVLSLAGAAQDLQSASKEIDTNISSISQRLHLQVNASSASSLRIGIMPNLTHAPALLSKHLHFLEETFHEAVDTRIFSAGPALTQALISGQIDIGYVGPGPILNAFVEQKGVRILAGVCQGGAALLVGEHTDIRTAGQLHGKTIAVPQFGNGQHILLRHLFRENSLRDVFRGGSVRVIQAKPSAIQELLKKREIDGALVPEPWVSVLLRSANARILLDWDQLFVKGRYPNTIVAVNETFLEQHPDKVRQFVKTHREAVQQIRQGSPDGYRAVIAELQQLTGVSMSTELLASAFNRIIWNDQIDPDSLKPFAELTEREGFLQDSARIQGVLVG